MNITCVKVTVSEFRLNEKGKSPWIRVKEMKYTKSSRLLWTSGAPLIIVPHLAKRFEWYAHFLETISIVEAGISRKMKKSSAFIQVKTTEKGEPRNIHTFYAYRMFKEAHMHILGFKLLYTDWTFASFYIFLYLHCR